MVGGRAPGGRGGAGGTVHPPQSRSQGKQRSRVPRAVVPLAQRSGGHRCPGPPQVRRRWKRGAACKGLKGAVRGGHCLGPPPQYPQLFAPPPPPPRCQLRPGQLITGVRGSTVVAPPRPCCPQGDPGGGPSEKAGAEGDEGLGRG